VALAQTVATATVAAPVPVSDILPPAQLGGLESTFEQIYTQVNPSVREHSGGGTGGDWHTRPAALAASPNRAGRGAWSGFVWTNRETLSPITMFVNRRQLDLGDLRRWHHCGCHSSGEMNPNADLAVIKVNVPAGQLQPVQVADSAQVKVAKLRLPLATPSGFQGA